MRLPPALASVLAFDSAGLAPLAGLRAALGVVLPLLVGAAAGHPADGAMAAAGALPVGVASMSGSLPTPPAGLLLATTTGMAVSTFVGSLAAGHPVAVVSTLVVWGFTAGLLVALGKAATITGVQAVIGLVVFGRYPGGAATSAVHGLAVLTGGLVQTALALLLRPPRRWGAERLALSVVYHRLAALATGGAHGGPSGEAIATAADLLTRRAPDVDVLRDLLDEGTRIRLELQALAAVPDLPGVRDVTGAAAGRLRSLARAIGDGEAPPPEPPDLADAVSALRDTAAATTGRTGTRTRFTAARAAAMLGQLRAADRLAAALAGERRIPLPLVAGLRPVWRLRGSATDGVRRLRETATDPSAPAFRHALRLAVLLPVADLLARLTPGGRGYWVPLTAAVVLKPDYAATAQRGLGRVAGTLLGVVVTGLLISVERPTGGALVIAVAVTAWASYALFAASFAVYSFALTALVVLLVSTGDPKPLAAVADRGLDTVIGGAIAMAGYLVWPTREQRTLLPALGRLLDTLADYAGPILDGYVNGRYDDQGDRPVLAARARAARRARADAQASLDRARAEPERVRPDVEVPMSLLGAARRIVISLHALRTTLQDTVEHEPLPEVASARDEVVQALRDLADGVRHGRRVELPDLRGAQHELERLADVSPDSLRGRRLALVAAHLDPLVDSIDTLAHVLADRSSAGVAGG